MLVTSEITRLGEGIGHWELYPQTTAPGCARGGVGQRGEGGGGPDGHTQHADSTAALTKMPRWFNAEGEGQAK